MPPTDAGGTRDTNVVLCWSITMPADGISAATRERGLRYVAVFWQLAWSHGEPNVSYKGSELKGFARSIWSGIELARITVRGTFETCQPY